MYLIEIQSVQGLTAITRYVATRKKKEKIKVPIFLEALLTIETM